MVNASGSIRLCLHLSSNLPKSVNRIIHLSYNNILFYMVDSECELKGKLAIPNSLFFTLSPTSSLYIHCGQNSGDFRKPCLHGTSSPVGLWHSNRPGATCVWYTFHSFPEYPSHSSFKVLTDCLPEVFKDPPDGMNMFPPYMSWKCAFLLSSYFFQCCSKVLFPC